MFDVQQGECEREEDETSYFNQLEVDKVISYVFRLLTNPKLPKTTQSDIGIITPYKKQMHLLQKNCAYWGWKDIEIGSVELFQGKEKPVIIASMVRSKMSNVGFLRNPKVQFVGTGTI